MTNSIQDKFIKNTLYVVIGIALIGLIAIQPYNIYCKVKKSCNPVTFSSFKLNKVGKKELEINFNVTVSEELKGKIEAKAKTSQIKAINGRDISSLIQIKNLTKENLNLGAMFEINPERVNEYLERFDCPCMQHVSINANDSEEMKINLRISPEIEKDVELKDLQNVTINYEVIIH